MSRFTMVGVEQRRLTSVEEKPSSVTTEGYEGSKILVVRKVSTEW